MPKPAITRKKSLGIKLKNLILSEELRPKLPSLTIPILNFHRPNLHSTNQNISTFKKTHHRSYSDATTGGCSTSATLLNTTRTLGDLSSGHAFDNGCICLETYAAISKDLARGQKLSCRCGAPRLSAEHEFVKSLINIGSRLQAVPGKDVKAQRLLAELSMLNLNLPARVWLPIYSFPHLIIRIPPGAAVLLNSKDKAPYLVYMETVDVHGDVSSAALPTKLINSLRQTKSEENLLQYCSLNGRNGMSTSNSQFTVCPANDNDNDCWGPEDDEVSKQYRSRLNNPIDRDTISQLSQDSSTSGEDNKNGAVFVAAGDIRRRLADSLNTPKNTFSRDPEDPSAAALKEPWEDKVNRIRDASPYGHLQGKLISLFVRILVTTY